MKKKIAVVFMVVGVVFIGLAMGLLFYNNYENRKAQESSDTIVETIRLNIAENKKKNDVADEPYIEADDPFDEEMTVEEIDGYDYIGYITVPSLDIDLPVMSEWDYDRLKISPCRHYGSVKTNNLVIAAHNYKVHFGYIGELEPGDQVIFTDMNAVVYKYKVDSVEILYPEEVDKVIDSGSDLILYTCTYSTSRRIVVRCSYDQ